MPEEVKLDPKFHVPEEDPDIHLQRLLAPQDLDEPFFKTLGKTINGIIHPVKLPPLEVTSKPVDPAELKGLRGLYSGNEWRAAGGSLLIEAAFIALVLILGTLKPVQKVIKEAATLVYVPPPPPLKEAKHGGGGGGARQPEVKKANLPAPRKFVQPPTTTPVQTKLEVPASLLDVPAIETNNVGNLTGLNALNGLGAGGGIGNGYGGGIGNGRGPGAGNGSGGGTGGGVYRPGGDVTNPKVIYQQEPQYSEEARKAKWQGSVMISLVVDEKGLPVQIHVVRPLGLGLDEKAVEAVSHWRFEPGKKNGKPVAVQAQIEVTFRLL